MNSLIVPNNDSYIFFTVGEYKYAFDTKCVLDIIQLIELSKPEAMPYFIAGLFEYNGKMIKVLDTKNILKLDTKPYNINSKIIIAKTNKDIMGIIVDDVIEIRTINSELLGVPPYKSETSLIRGIYTDKDFSSTVINLEHLEKKIKDSAHKNYIPKALIPNDPSSKAIMHRRLLHYAETKHRVNYEIIKSEDTYITFLLNNNTYCTKIAGVGGFYKFVNLKLTKVPCTPNFIIGVTNINGRYITVIDLIRYIEQNNETEISKNTIVIVIEYEDYQIGILADEIGETIDIDKTLVKINTENSPNCLTEFVLNDNLYVFLDSKKLFGDEKLYVS